MALRVGFMGTPDFAAAALRAIHDSAHELVCVYSQPPRPKGRGYEVQPSPVHDYAEEAGIPVFTPKTLKTAEEQQEFAAHNLDVAVVAAYGLILPEAVLTAPKHGCLNIHASLLPRWRGASPIQQAIWAGDEETGITIMQMDKGLDTGPVIEARSLPLTQSTTATALHDELAALGAEMIVESLDRLAADGKLDAAPQDDELSTYAPLLKKEDGRVDWSQNAVAIDRQVRALNPWPGVWSTADGKRIKILEAIKSVRDHEEPPGTILDREGRVACGEDTVLQILKLQPEGKKPMDFPAAVNGGYVATSEKLS